MGEYTVKIGKKKSTQTKQFKLEYCAFLKLEKFGQLESLSKFVSDEDIMLADSATLKVDNHKNGWKVVCVHQHVNGGKSCAEFVPFISYTTTSVRFQAAVGKYGYQHIGKTAKIAVTSLMRTCD